MKKRFNSTGTCYADQHYMMDNREKVAKVYELVERGMYFSINRRRQYGKTTTLFAIYDKLLATDTYFPIRLNFQGVDEKFHHSDGTFAEMFIYLVFQHLKFNNLALANFLKDKLIEVKDLTTLSEVITDLVHFSPKKLVLLIDEVDASSNYTSFL